VEEALLQEEAVDRRGRQVGTNHRRRERLDEAKERDGGERKRVHRACQRPQRRSAVRSLPEEKVVFFRFFFVCVFFRLAIHFLLNHTWDMFATLPTSGPQAC
jgi:hypothetical protein